MDYRNMKYTSYSDIKSGINSRLMNNAFQSVRDTYRSLESNFLNEYDEH